MNRKEVILQDNVYVVGGRVSQNIDAPNGVALPIEIEALKEEFFTTMVNHLASELVETEKKYPVANTMDVVFSADFIVMKRKDFEELLTLDIEVNE
jgi:hypothetical protein